MPSAPLPPSARPLSPPPPHHNNVADSISIASLSAPAAVAQGGIEALASNTPLGWDPFSPAPPRGTEPREAASSRSASSPPASGAAEEDHLAWCRGLPWWKRPSDAVLRVLVFLIALSTGLAVPVRVEFFDQLACELLYYVPTPGHAPGMPTSASSPTVNGMALLFQRASDGLVAPHLPYGPDDPALCHTPAVLALSANLQMRITVVGGLLSVLTTGWWSGRSDRLGRRSVMIWGALSMVLNAMVFVITATIPRHRLPFGPNFMLLGAILEGLAGGMPTSMAAFCAYISDATPPGTKAMGYSMLLGLFFIAMAVGPIIGGRIVAVSGLVSVFYVAAALMLLYFSIVLFVLPESCSPSALVHARKQHEERSKVNKDQLDLALDSATSWTHKLRAYFVFHASHLFQPLTVLIPAQAPAVSPTEQDCESSNGGSSPVTLGRRRSTCSAVGSIGSPEASASYISVSHVSRRWKRDYNLLLVAAAMWFEASVMGALASKMLYAQQHFHWGAPDMGGFLTAAALSRVLALTLILPLAIKILHRPVRTIVLPQDTATQAQEDLDYEGRRATHVRTPNPASLENPSSVRHDAHTFSAPPTPPTPPPLLLEQEIGQAWTVRTKQLRLLHDSHFDLRLAQVSIAIATVCYVGLAAARTSGWFILWTCLACLGSGAGAANSSLAVALLRNPKDAGRLFGATSTLEAIGQTVIGPIIYTRVYQATADTAYSWAIFVLAAGMFGTSLLLLCLVRVRKPNTLPALPARPSRASLS